MLNANKHIHLAVGVEHAALDTYGKSLGFHPYSPAM